MGETVFFFKTYAHFMMCNKLTTAPFFLLFLFQAQLRASLAKLWDLEVPTQVRSPKRGPSGDIDCGSPEGPVHTPSLYSFFVFFSQKP